MDDKDILEKRKKIDDAIRTCMWRNTAYGENNAVCRGILLPCAIAIMDGECDTLNKMHEDGEI